MIFVLLFLLGMASHARGIEFECGYAERVNENETLREKVYCPVRAHSMVVGGGLIHTSAGNLGA